MADDLRPALREAGAVLLALAKTASQENRSVHSIENAHRRVDSAAAAVNALAAGVTALSIHTRQEES